MAAVGGGGVGLEALEEGRECVVVGEVFGSYFGHLGCGFWALVVGK